MNETAKKPMHRQKRDIARIYRKLRAQGYRSPEAWRCAKTINSFEWAEYNDCVRILAEMDNEPYDPGDADEPYTNQYGRRVSADEARKEIEHMLELNGNWIVISEYKNPISDEWEMADCIGGCAGYNNPTSAYENPYVIDLMQSALDSLKNNEGANFI